MSTGQNRVWRSTIAATSIIIAGLAGAAATPVAADGASGTTTYLAQVAGKVDVGGDHACAVTDAGEVWCWGWNLVGQLGDGTNDTADTPVAVVGLPSPGRAQAVATGRNFTCALLVDGSVSCWGDDYYGQLGDGPTNSSSNAPLAPIDLPGSGFAQQISAAEDYACALLTDGAVTCWGDDANGQLGNGAAGAQTSPPAPITLPGPGTAKAVSAGADHVCVVLTDGGVTCWGQGLDGRLGNGGTSTVTAPPAPITLPSPGTAAAVSAGYRHSCAVLTSGAVTCWGQDFSGELGNGTGSTDDVLTPPSPITLPGSAIAASVSAGFDGTCVVLSDGDVSCWGTGRYYRLGTGSIVTSHSPSSPIDMPGAYLAYAVAVGDSTVCALAGAGVVCWGDDIYGTAGVGTLNGDNQFPSDPFDVIGANPVDGLTSYVQGNCSLQSASGVLRCWGLNDDGQLGLGTSDSEAHDAPGARVTFPAPDSVVMADGFMEHICAVQSGGQLACWGLDQNGQVGNGSATSVEEPTPVAITLPSPGTATDVGTGYSFSCALLTDGKVTCWGSDDDGQLGNGATTGLVHAPPATITLPAPGTASKIDAGYAFACALLTDGKVTCWGNDSSDQLGNGAASADVTAPPAPITLPGPGTAVDIELGERHACALLTDGSVACWGEDLQGQVGNGGVPGWVNTPVLISMPGGLDATELALGWDHSCARLTGFSVACWGGGGDGQLGYGDREDRHAATAVVPLPTDAIAITAGYDSTCAALDTGLVTCWGADSYGQIGNGEPDGDAVHSPSYFADLNSRPVWVPDFTPLAPARLLDTRPAGATVDDLFEATGTVAGGSTVELQVGGRGGVAPNAEAATLNVTAVAPTGTGWVTVYPCGEPQPNASNLNVVNGVNVANAVVAQLGEDGKVCLYASVTMHLLADVSGVAPTASGFAGAAPERFMETRSGVQYTTIDGQFQGAGQMAAGSTTELQITGRGSTPISASAEAVILNVTAVTPPGSGYLTVYPCGETRPNASNLNFVPGRSTPNSVLVGIGTGGDVCIYNSSATHLIVDVVGVLTSIAHTTATQPKRLVETRVGPLFTTFDGEYEGLGKVTAGSTHAFQVAPRAVNGDTRFVWLNVTSIQSEAGGFLTVYSCDIAQPNASNLNFPVGVTVANSVLVEIGESGDVCVYSSATTHLVVDLDGILINGYAPPV